MQNSKHNGGESVPARASLGARGDLRGGRPVNLSPTITFIHHPFARLPFITSTEDRTMREDLKPGNPFPDFRLPNQDGTEVSLSELMGGWPVVLTFNRGNY